MGKNIQIFGPKKMFSSLKAQQKLQRWIVAILFFGIFWRLWLTQLFWGWEESDYGNLQMVRGVFESHFTSYDMNHMPGYYAIAALLLFVFSDTVWAAIGCSFVSGCMAFLLSILIQQKMAGRLPAIFLGVALLIQPEFSLYSASSLREPLYTVYLLGMLWALIHDRFLGASIFAALSFTVRFEAPVALFPLLIYLLFRKEKRMPIVYVLPMILTIILWMWYCHETFGHVRFWQHAGAVNIETGLGDEAQDTSMWMWNGLRISTDLFFGLLPNRLGWGIFVGLCLSPFVLSSSPNVRILQYLGYGLLAVWLSIAYIAQHEPQHNLYWKWLYPVIPFLMAIGVLTLWKLIEKGNIRWIWGIVLLQALIGHGLESKRQIDRSKQLYLPQVQIANMLEQEYPNGHLILDNIPACWLGRKSHDMKLTSWFDVPTKNAEEFAHWISVHQVDAVLWFAEDWTQAPKVAPFLSEGGTWPENIIENSIEQQIQLREVRRDDAYGWILYQRK